jgi:hypothetical protein
MSFSSYFKQLIGLNLILFLITGLLRFLSIQFPGRVAESATEISFVAAFLAFCVLVLSVPLFIVWEFFSTYRQEKRDQQRWPSALVDHPFWGILTRKAGSCLWEGYLQHESLGCIPLAFFDPIDEQSMVRMKAFWEALPKHNAAAKAYLAKSSGLAEDGFMISSFGSGLEICTCELSYGHPHDQFGGWDVILRDGQIIDNVYGD